MPSYPVAELKEVLVKSSAVEYWYFVEILLTLDISLAGVHGIMALLVISIDAILGVGASGQWL